MNLAVAYRAIARGDLVLFAVLAIPGPGGIVLQWILRANEALGLGGAAEPSEALLLFVHLLGVLGVGWAWLRLHAGACAASVRASIAVKFAAALLFALYVGRGIPVAFVALGAIDFTQGLVLLCLQLASMPKETVKPT